MPKADSYFCFTSYYALFHFILFTDLEFGKVWNGLYEQYKSNITHTELESTNECPLLASITYMYKLLLW